MGIEYDDNVNDIAFETTARDKAGPALANSTPDTIFQKAVVIDVINDPAAFRSQAKFDETYNETTIDNFGFIKRVPRNTVIARVLNDGQGKRTSTFTLCLPFFPPHLCFPIKPGEHVWLISPAPIGKGAKVFYWMCRVPTWNDADDINYTHEDRIHHYISGEEDKQKTSDKVHNEVPKAENSEDPELFGFPNGNATQDGYTFGEEENQYDIHVTGSLAYKSFKFEPVPRLTKMPGDLVLQGSNNSSITLGTSRGYKGGFAETRTDTNRIKDHAEQSLEKEGKMIRSSATMINPSAEELQAPDMSSVSAAIDIVAGRSLRKRRNPVITATPTSDTDPPIIDNSQEAPGFPRIKKTVNPENVRGENLVEVSKNPQAYLEDIKDNHLDHAIEGDPDFRYDASRIYMTADSNPDADFGLTDQVTQLPGGLAAEDKEGASVVVKSDHVRIIARKDPDDLAGKVNGSIRIIKEGKPRPPTDSSAKPPEGERAIITIESDGTIILDGPRVVIGNGHLSSAQLASNMAGNYTSNDNVYIGGQDAQHSVFLAEELADTLVAFAVDVVNMLGATGGNAKSYGSGGNNNTPSVSASLGNSSSPIVNPTAFQAVTTLQQNLEKSMSKVIKIK